jgi:hypothetical protein
LNGVDEVGMTCAGGPDGGGPAGSAAASVRGDAAAPFGAAATALPWGRADEFPPADAKAVLSLARPDQCGLSGSLIAVRTIAELPIPELIVSCNDGTGVTATGSGAPTACLVSAERDWAQPAAAQLRRNTANTRFMIGLVSILGDGQPRQARTKRKPIARPTAVLAIAAFRENRSRSGARHSKR